MINGIMNLNGGVLLFAKASINVLHLIVIFVSLIIGFNPDIESLLRGYSWHMGGSEYGLHGISILLIQILIVILCIAIYSILMAFWILLFSINDHLESLNKIQKDKGDSKHWVPIKRSN